MNNSWNKMKKILQGSGITNHNFMMALQNEKLKDVDPWSDKLSEDIKNDIMFECKNNIWYFLRECVKIRCSGNYEYYEINPETMAFFYLYTKKYQWYYDRNKTEIWKNHGSRAFECIFNVNTWVLL